MASKKKNQAELNAEIDKMVRNAGQSVNSTGIASRTNIIALQSTLVKAMSK